jgi:hypothetical protein
MGKYIETSQIDSLMYKFKQVTEKAVAGGAEAMRDEAKKMRDLASLMAPRLHGTLEDSIEVEDERGDRNRVEVKLYVNGSITGPTGQPVSEYAKRMEENDPEYKLGEKSRAKNEGVAGALGFDGPRKGYQADQEGAKGVGPHFLARALRKGRGSLGRRIAERMRAAINRAAR